MKQVRPAPPRQSIGARFKAEIEQAVSQGVALDAMTLHLAPGDLEHLKRDRTIAVADISFAGGAMTYLGVAVVVVPKIAKGEVPLSMLRLNEA